MSATRSWRSCKSRPSRKAPSRAAAPTCRSSASSSQRRSASPPRRPPRRRRLMHRFAAIAAVGILLAAPVAGSAQEATPFFKGKTIRMVISTGVAGGYAEYARAMAEHMGRHIAGNPGFFVQSMPGAGGLLAANYLYTQAPQDGTTIGIVHSSVPLAPLWGTKGARFDTQKFNWLGSLDRVDGMCIAWHASPIRNWADMLSKEYTVG